MYLNSLLTRLIGRRSYLLFKSVYFVQHICYSICKVRDMTAPIILLNLSLVCLCPVVLFGDISGARNVIPSLLAPDPLPSLPLLGGFLQLHPEFARDCQPRSPWVPHVAVALVAGAASAEALVPKDLPEFHRWWSNTPPPAPLQKKEHHRLHPPSASELGPSRIPSPVLRPPWICWPRPKSPAISYGHIPGLNPDSCFGH